METYKAGFVNIFGAPNAGKSTFLNQLLGENLVITSPKVQTTRHSILGILTTDQYQMVFSDTPGIMDTQYKLHEKMMKQVTSAAEDADVAIWVHDITQPIDKLQAILPAVSLQVPTLLLLNKTDKHKGDLEPVVAPYRSLVPNWHIVTASAKKGSGMDAVMQAIVDRLPLSPPYYPEDTLTDRSERFFVAEIIRQHIFTIYIEEIPYHTTVIIQSFEDKATLTVIKAEIIASRETQKIILIGKGGSMINKLCIAARKQIEEFLQRKVHLDLYVKVRPHWRDNDTFLKEYGYN